jgi:bifunctional non-homologous end joining protein LigD
LALLVPDHELIYIDFEGIIPEGNYGAGPVVIWDTGEFVPLETDDPLAAMTSGKLSFELKGKKLKGAFTLAQMRGIPKSTGKEWLLIKKKDNFALSYFAIRSELTPARLAKLKKRLPPCKAE